MTAPADRDPRVPLAIERTYLAWIRTGLAMMGFGFVVARFGVFLREVEAMGRSQAADGVGPSMIAGTAMIALGVIVSLYGTVRFHRNLIEYERGDEVRVRRGVPTAIAILLAGIGVLTILYFIAMN